MAFVFDVIRLGLLLAIMVAGLLLIAAPSLGLAALKKLGGGIGLLVLSSLLVQPSCEAMSIDSIVEHGFLNAIVFAGIWLLLGGGFLHLFSPARARRFLKSSAVIVGCLIFAIVSVSELRHATNSFVFVLLCAVSSTGAYLIRERRVHRGDRREARHHERTPILPSVPPEHE
jgi:hypothetical protein